MKFDGEKVKAMIMVHWWSGWEMLKNYLEWREPEGEGGWYNSDGSLRSS